MTSRVANEDRDEDRDPVAGFETKAGRAGGFDALMVRVASTRQATADGAVHAYVQITGDDGKPHVAAVEDTRTGPRLATSAKLDAFA